MKRYQSAGSSGKFGNVIKLGALLGSLGIISLMASSCELLGISLKVWKLSGDANHNVPALELGTKKVKMAAFLFPGGDGCLTSTRTMVSDCVVVDSTPSDFSLTIDTTDLTPQDGDRIILYMWIDSDTGVADAYDDGELRCIVANTATDTVFAPNSFADFTYYANRKALEDGWYYNAPSGAQEVSDLSGALLTNDVHF